MNASKPSVAPTIGADWCILLLLVSASSVFSQAIATLDRNEYDKEDNNEKAPKVEARREGH